MGDALFYIYNSLWLRKLFALAVYPGPGGRQWQPAVHAVAFVWNRFYCALRVFMELWRQALPVHRLMNFR